MHVSRQRPHIARQNVVCGFQQMVSQGRDCKLDATKDIFWTFHPPAMDHHLSENCLRAVLLSHQCVGFKQPVMQVLPMQSFGIKHVDVMLWKAFYRMCQALKCPAIMAVINLLPRSVSDAINNLWHKISVMHVSTSPVTTFKTYTFKSMIMQPKGWRENGSKGMCLLSISSFASCKIRLRCT